MKQKYFLFAILWIFVLSSWGWAINYSEGNSTVGWSVYDNTPIGATITTELGSIKLSGRGGRNAYILGNKRANRTGAWNNHTEKSIRFKMKYSEALTLYVIAYTDNGVKYIIYNTEDVDSSANLSIGLGSSLVDGTWHTIHRNIEEDLQKFEAGNKIISIEGIIVRGSGFLDDIELVNDSITVSSGTLYSSPWRVYDNTPTGATITTEGETTHFSGHLTRNAYMLGNKKLGRDNAWNNRTQKLLTLDINYDEAFVFYIFIDTEKGLRALLYTSDNNDVLTDFSTGLGESLVDGTWKHIERNLEKDLQKFESNNKILATHGIIVRGSGFIKNIILDKVTTIETEDTFIPAYDYGSKIDYYDTTAHGAWFLPDNPYGLSLIREGNAYLVKTVDDEVLGKRNGYTTKVDSKRFNLDPTKRYQALIRIKAKSYPYGQNLLVTVRGPKGDKGKSKWEVNWNVSSTEWEELSYVLDPSVIDNPQGNEWYFQFMSSTAFRAFKPSLGSDMLIDENIDVFEIPEGKQMVNSKDINFSKDKIEYISSFRKIDKWGNFYIKEGARWKHIFPKLIYRDANLDDNESEAVELFKRYKDYGFNGIVNIESAQQVREALKYGLTNISIEASPLNKKGEDVNYSFVENRFFSIYSELDSQNADKYVIWYNLDNENQNITEEPYHLWLTGFLNNRKDTISGKRRYPVYYLNGQYGLTRAYKNTFRDYIDVTGSYVGDDVNGSYKNGKKDIRYRIASQFMTEKQIAPASVIQLQKHFSTKFIPSLFWGIIQGGRAVNVWRDGQPFDTSAPQLIGSPDDFRESFWANAFRDEVSPRLDQMLPIIEVPQFTSWSAVTDNYPVVRIGTREVNGKGYLILSNFSEEDKLINVKVNNFIFSSARDYFSQESINVNANSITFDIGHHNHGYKVIELLK